MVTTVIAVNVYNTCYKITTVNLHCQVDSVPWRALRNFGIYYHSLVCRYICAGSENHCVFLWSTLHVPQSLAARKDRNNFYEAIRYRTVSRFLSLHVHSLTRQKDSSQNSVQKLKKDISASHSTGQFRMPMQCCFNFLLCFSQRHNAVDNADSLFSVQRIVLQTYTV